MKFEDVESAFDFVNSAPPFEHTAYVSRSTGETYWQSEMGDLDELPDDVAENDDFVEIPNGRDLDLGTRLVWDFVDQHVPGLYDQVRSAFSRKGAYGRFRTLLEEHGSLEQWNDFEEKRTKEALLRWCKDHNISLDSGE